MTLKEKVSVYLKSKGLTQLELAKLLKIDYKQMNKNIAADKLTINMAIGMARLFPDLDMNWLMRENVKEPACLTTEEPAEEYVIVKKHEQKIEEIKRLLDELKEDLAQK